MTENLLIALRRRLADSKHTVNVQSQDLLTAAAVVLTCVFMYTNTNRNRVLSIHEVGKEYHRGTGFTKNMFI